MKLYELNNDYYINLDAVCYAIIGYYGQEIITLHLADGSTHDVSHTQWEEIKALNEK